MEVAATSGVPHLRVLKALVITPTRELAHQIRDHLLAVAKYTGIKICAVVGGLASSKQQRLLSYRPEVVIATPGMTSLPFYYEFTKPLTSLL